MPINYKRGPCPLGAKCEEVSKTEPDTIYRCPWYAKLIGKDAQGKDRDEFDCAIAWFPILQVEVANTNRGNADAVISLRDETVKRQDVFNAIAMKSLADKEQITA